MRELYGTASCPFTRDLRENLAWEGHDFVEYDVERDAEAKRRLSALCGAPLAVPVLVEGGRVVQIGVGGRSCYVTPA